MSTTAAPPTGPRHSGQRGRRGGRSGGGSNPAALAHADDTEEVRKLRSKFGDKLGMLKELFSDWTDEDLLFALQDAGGEVELAVGRISEGGFICCLTLEIALWVVPFWLTASRIAPMQVTPSNSPLLSPRSRSRRIRCRRQRRPRFKVQADPV